MSAAVETRAVSRSWDAPYVLRQTIVASRLASRSTCLRAEADGYLTPFRRGGRGPVAYRTEQVDRWIRGDVPGATAANSRAKPNVQRRRSGSTSTVDALARIEAVGRMGGRR